MELTFEQQKHKTELERVLNAKLEVRRTNEGTGKISIPFSDDDDLSRILDLLNP
jgi:hypothetical protein